MKNKTKKYQSVMFFSSHLPASPAVRNLKHFIIAGRPIYVRAVKSVVNYDDVDPSAHVMEGETFLNSIPLDSK